MSDLPDYQRNIQVVAGEADVAEYDATPEDISDGERGPILIDSKGRTIMDLGRIDGVDVDSDGDGILKVKSDLITLEGIAFPNAADPGCVPTILRNAYIGYNPCLDLFKVDCSSTYVDVSNRAARLLGRVYGSQGQQLQQKATSYELKTYDSFVEALLGGGLPAALDAGALKIKEQNPLAEIKLWDGTNYLATPGVGDAIARGVFLFGSDYGSQTPTAQIVKVDSSGRLSCVLG